jgi:hypothetical protein
MSERTQAEIEEMETATDLRNDEDERRWRVGRKVPINVYEGDRPVCQCQTPEYAARIVAAMNLVRAMDAGKALL